MVQKERPHLKESGLRLVSQERTGFHFFFREEWLISKGEWPQELSHAQNSLDSHVNGKTLCFE